MLNLLSRRASAVSIAATMLTFGSGAVYAEPITYFSHSLSFVQAQSTGFSQGPDFFQEAFGPNGGFVNTSRSLDAPEGIADASSSGNLSTGELKAFSEVTASGDGGFFSAFGRTDIGDSFRTFAGGSPFSWSSATEVSFSFDVSGLVELNDAGNGSGLFLTILAPGALDAYARWLNGEDSFDEWNSQVITEFSYTLGPGQESHPWTTELLTSYPDTVSATFAPGSDFDWVMGLISTVDINGSFAAADAHGLVDFAHTITVSYDGPGNATTYSASGLFPNTSALSTAPTGATEVPEPASALLVLTGLGALAVARRRRK